MQAIILAAGKSTRTHPLTVNIPKPLLKIANKTILEHNLEQLVGIVKEVIIVVGFKANMIKKHIGNKFKGLKIKYILQREQLGTGHAVNKTKRLIKDKFILMGGDDLFHKEDIERCLKYDYCILAQKVEDPSRFGVIVAKGQNIKKIVEKPKRKISNLANTGLYILNKKIFDFEIKKSERGEYEVIDYINELIKKEKVYFSRVKNYWLPIGYPWDLISANEILLNNIESDIKGTIEKGVVVKGNIKVGKGTTILSGVYIEGNVIIGENCKIGPNCYLRGKTSIGDKCHIGQAVEIKNSIIMDGTKVPHLSYIGDSVIGQRTNLGAGTTTANLRHDDVNIRTPVKEVMTDTGRKKLGTIIAEDVHTGIHTSIYPGRKIWPGLITKPGEVIRKDIRK